MRMLNAKLIGLMERIILLMLMMVAITACSVMPESIQHQNTQQISLQAVQQNTSNFKGQTVRWGGVITQVINKENETWIELLALSLSDVGRPSSSRKSNQGRFIAKIEQFLDPEVYQEGESLTVVGVLDDKIDGKIGDYNYSFPVVVALGHHLWSKIIYRQYPPIAPGYWYYGFHPYWHFGYSYYGFGVRHFHGYYPYYPFFGHLARDARPFPLNRRPGYYNPGNYLNWPVDTSRFSQSWNQIRANHFRTSNRRQTSNFKPSNPYRTHAVTTRTIKPGRTNSARRSNISNAPKPRPTDKN